MLRLFLFLYFKATLSSLETTRSISFNLSVEAAAAVAVVDIFKSEVLAWIVAIFVFSSWVQARSIRFNLSVAAALVDIFKSEAFSPLCHLFAVGFLIKGTCPRCGTTSNQPSYP